MKIVIKKEGNKFALKTSAIGVIYFCNTQSYLVPSNRRIIFTEGAIESTSNLKRPPSEYEMTIKTLQWLKKVDSGCYDEPAEPAPPVAPVPAIPAPPKPKPANVSM